MSQNNENSHNFASDIPQHILENSSEGDKYMLNSISILNQTVSHLCRESEKHSKLLGNVCELQKIANGRTSKNEAKIAVLEKIEPTVDQIKEDIRLIVLIKRALGNKLTYILLILLAIGSYTVFNAVTTNKVVQKDIKVIAPIVQAVDP